VPAIVAGWASACLLRPRLRRHAVLRYTHSSRREHLRAIAKISRTDLHFFAGRALGWGTGRLDLRIERFDNDAREGTFWACVSLQKQRRLRLAKTLPSDNVSLSRQAANLEIIRWLTAYVRAI